jgi:hypothetical protein
MMLISRAEAISQRLRRPQNGVPPRSLKNKALDRAIKAKLDPIAGQPILVWPASKDRDPFPPASIWYCLAHTPEAANAG